MHSKADVLCVCLDAADPTLVADLAAAGELPTLARLLDQGAVVDTVAPEGVFVSANWPSIFTASTPDRHGYLCWEEYRGGTYEHRQTTPQEVRGDPLWRSLSRAGKRVGVFDVPHSIVEPLNGVMVAEWGCHDRHFGTHSFPESLAADLAGRHGHHVGSMDPPGLDQFAPCDYTARAGRSRTADETVALVDALRAGIASKSGASLELLDAGGWDFFLTVISETHCIGHQLWNLHDPSHPGHDPSLVERVGGDPVADIYRRADAVVADHLARLGPDATAYVLMPHGMTAHNDGTHLFDHVLHRLDWLLDDPTGLGAGTQAAAQAARLLPRPVRRSALRLSAPLLRGRVSDAPPAPLPPLHERRFYMTPNNTVVGAVRLNMSGREPAGRIDSADRRKVLRWLADRLQELVNVDTGGPVVRRCVIAEDVYRRTPTDGFGDLFVEWERSAPIERVWSPATGTVAVPYDHWRQGDHVRQGRLLATGPGIEPGRRRAVASTPDVGATFAAAAGVRLEGVDGRPLESVLPRRARTPRPRRKLATRARDWTADALSNGARASVPDWASRSVAAPGAAADAAENRSRAIDERLTATETRVRALERQSQIAAMTAWLPHAQVPEDLLVSIVMPTRDRREFLETAVASVLEQSYRRWELLIVDDRSTDDTRVFLESLDDPRIRTLKSDGSGVCRARNVGLDAARGDVIAYLDDDNRYDPEWLKAVALAFATHPDASACYGVRVFDDEGRVLRGVPSGSAVFHFLEWDAEGIRNGNLADINVLAHRPRGLYFDETITVLGDWDLIRRLTEDEAPLAVPAIAAYYRTDTPNRLSDLGGDEVERDYRYVRAK